jgi:c(7)-type cytochrome triheme protein
MKRFLKSKRLALLVLVVLPIMVAWAEYGDVVINVRAKGEGMAPVIFPHWFHRVRFQCSVCHVDIGFKTRAGGSGITMDKISQGQFCGACHNGEIAWSAENCDFCHSGMPGLETGVEGGHKTAGPGYY